MTIALIVALVVMSMIALCCFMGWLTAHEETKAKREDADLLRSCIREHMKRHHNVDLPEQFAWDGYTTNGDCLGDK